MEFSYPINNYSNVFIPSILISILSKFPGKFSPPAYGPIFKSLVRKGQIFYRFKNRKFYSFSMHLSIYFYRPTYYSLEHCCWPKCHFPPFPLIFIRGMISFDIILKKLIWTFDVRKKDQRQLRRWKYIYMYKRSDRTPDLRLYQK